MTRQANLDRYCFVMPWLQVVMASDEEFSYSNWSPDLRNWESFNGLPYLINPEIVLLHIPVGVTQNICCNHPKIWTRRLYQRVRHPKDAAGIANSVDLSVRKLRIITVKSSAVVIFIIISEAVSKTKHNDASIVKFIFYFGPLRSAIIFWEIRNKWLV